MGHANSDRLHLQLPSNQKMFLLWPAFPGKIFSLARAEDCLNLYALPSLQAVHPKEYLPGLTNQRITEMMRSKGRTMPLRWWASAANGARDSFRTGLELAKVSLAGRMNWPCGHFRYGALDDPPVKANAVYQALNRTRSRCC